MRVRPASRHDINPIADLLQRAQWKLTGSGSLQRLAVLSPEDVGTRVRSGTAHVLEAGSGILGVVFLGPVTAEALPSLADWGLADPALRLWYLQSLVVEPSQQGRGLGLLLMEGARTYAAEHGGETIVLDCWAGNSKLRDFYARAGFSLHGVFPEEDYEVAVFAGGLGGSRGGHREAADESRTAYAVPDLS